jgi:ubiquitin carboxyl-terminal hydrolase 9/24
MMKTGVKLLSDTLLEGHLSIAKELVGFLPPEKRTEIGLQVDPEDLKAQQSAPEDPNTLHEFCLIRDLLDNFLFPATRQLIAVRGRERSVPELTKGKLDTPVCNTRNTCIAAHDLLVGLGCGSVQNYQCITKLLTDMFYSDASMDSVINEWEFALPVGPRSSKGFVGLKNAGATCYMNSVMQQLFMIEPVRLGILAAEGAVTDPDEDFSGEESSSVSRSTEGSFSCGDAFGSNAFGSNASEEAIDRPGSQRGQNQVIEYNVGILKQIQAIFGHLAASRLQYYVPRGLWKHFR